MFSKKTAFLITMFLAVAFVFSACGSQVKQKKNNNSNSTKSTAASGNVNKENNSKSSETSPEKKKENSTESEFKSFEPLTLSSISGLSTKKIEWSWKYSPQSNAAVLAKYHGFAFGDTSKKVIYLTFDEGYENGYTPSILDTLKANDVKATFFVTEPYVTGSYNGVKDVDLLKRMYNEGHIIGNHSVHHKSMPSIKDESVFDSEILDNEKTVDSIPGIKMTKFFRPPMGDFSELSLYYTQKLGYRSIFFALAHNDYDPKNQPNPETAKANLLKETRPGMICLLHAVSKTNTEILGDLIKTWKSEGYEFKTLNDLP